MKKAVLYARVSSDLQHKEKTIESQIAELKKQISKAGDTLVKEYVDDGYSGAYLDRPAMNELRDDLKAQLFNTIYILNTDRIARDVTYQNIIVGEMLRYKKQIIINGKDYIHNPENKFTLTVLGAVSELERAKLIERTLRGRQHRLSQGRLLSNGHQTYGYTYNRKTTSSSPSYAINEKEAEVVRYIFETYANNETSIHSISRHLVKIGAGVRGRNCLVQSNIRGILKNEMYTGIRYSNTMSDRDMLGTYENKRGKQMPRDRSEWVPIPVPAIISKELFDKVQVRLEHNRVCYRNAKRPRLLSGLIWCDACKSRCYAYRRAYQIRYTKPIQTFRRAVYKCNSNNPGSHNPEVNIQVIESCVWDMVTETMTNPKKLYDSIEFIKRKTVANHTKSEKQLDDVKERIKTIATQKKRIVDLYVSGELEREEYVKRVRVFDKEIESLEAKRGQILKFIPLFQKPELVKSCLTEYCKGVRRQLTKCVDFPTKRQFALDFVTKVAYERKGRTYVKVKVYGLVPIKLDSEPETVPVRFKIEHTVKTYQEMSARLPKGSQEDEAYYGLALETV